LLLQMAIGQFFVRKLPRYGARGLSIPALFQPENVVCTHKQDTNIKIIDFGLAKLLGPEDKVSRDSFINGW
jgi:hypothetical protein